MRPGRADEEGRVEGRAAGFGRVGEGSWGVLRARGVGLLAREGMGRSGVRGEPLGERGRCGEGPLWRGAAVTAVESFPCYRHCSSRLFH